MAFPTSRRWGARLLVLFFALFWSEGVVLASCPMHKASRAHAGHGAHHGGAPAEQPGSTDGACECLGSCAGATTLLLASAPVLARDVVVGGLVEHLPRPELPRDLAPQVRLAPAQGPPIVTIG